MRTLGRATTIENLILSLSKDEVVALPMCLPSWFDMLTMRALDIH
jgi:hypothetical protein